MSSEIHLSPNLLIWSAITSIDSLLGFWIQMWVLLFNGVLPCVCTDRGISGKPPQPGVLGIQKA